MIFYVDYKTKKIISDQGNQFFQAENLVNKISVYMTNVTDITYYLSMEFLLPNGRRSTMLHADAFASGEAQSTTVNNVIYAIHNFTLSDTVLQSAGTLAFTCYMNVTDTNGNVVQRGVILNGVNQIVKTVPYGSSTLVTVGVGADANQVVADMKSTIATVSAAMSNKMGTDGTGCASIVNLLALKSTEIYEGGTKLSSKYHPFGGANSDFTADCLEANSVSVSEGLFIENHDVFTLFHPFGGSEDEEFSADIIYANNLVCESDISECGQNLSARYHPKGGNANIDFTTRDLTATQGTVGNLSITQELTASSILVGDNECPVATEEFVNESVSRSNLVSTIGNASSFIGGLMSTDDKSHLDTLFALLGNENGDSDSVVNTIREVLSIFNNYPEGANLVNALSLKASMEWVNGQCYSKTYIDTNYSTTAQVTAMLPTALSTSDMTEILGVFN